MSWNLRQDGSRLAVVHDDPPLRFVLTRPSTAGDAADLVTALRMVEEIEVADGVTEPAPQRPVARGSQLPADDPGDRLVMDRAGGFGPRMLGEPEVPDLEPAEVERALLEKMAGVDFNLSPKARASNFPPRVFEDRASGLTRERLELALMGLLQRGLVREETYEAHRRTHARLVVQPWALRGAA